MDDIVHLWNSHRIRQSRSSVAPSGKPLMMYNLPHLYGTTNQLCAIDERTVQEVQVLCSYKCIPCDETVFELCNILMEEQTINHHKVQRMEKHYIED